MTNLDVSSGHVLSTSPGTPHLTINHDIAADLDSTNAFEGPEKLLEVWFSPSAKSLPAGAKENGLKAVSPTVWEGMLDLVNCKVLSIVKSEHVDAYLLSESSMFVFPHKIILKTCGTTTLLLGLRRLLRIAAIDAGFPFHNATSLEDVRAAATPHRVFYSRKNFLFPDRQHGPHRDWKEEVAFLDDMFENGSAYMVGRMNSDHWYLYLTSLADTLTPPRTPSSSNNGSPTRTTKIPTGITLPFSTAAESSPDETLEILMTDLDPELSKQFYLPQASAVASAQILAQAKEKGPVGDSDSTFDVFSNGGESDLPGSSTNPGRLVVVEAPTTEGHALGTVVSDTCGLSEVYPVSSYPEARIDAYLFSPCGFSANGVIPAPHQTDDSASKAAHYFTVHVTPEPHCSFASFETNVPGGQNGRQTSDVIEHVVNIFRPGRFSVTLFEMKGRSASDVLDGDIPRATGLSSTKQRLERIKGYRRTDRIVHEFEDYDLVFRFFERDGWVGDGGARVGEDL
ncbi:S-adenosylmethionine decarboxylase [Lasiosphaeria miniovina]|uniref:adenosylmethionine decarboxylase n=1 Tax=Lasiosphaeria miniovina TaxID=1954250 RepID=A0AA40B4N3_9PEZI|nr:S-adenosylmethionine decarboxylase [Lasiosphaeria miniovina]KAK0727646.1 S-adenosylmethionine decarboxylase [Lasiosphaeria miniovina]